MLTRTLVAKSIFAIVLIATLSYETLIDTQTSHDQTWPIVRVNKSIDNIALSPYDYHIYASAEGNIYKYSEELDLIAMTHVATGYNNKFLHSEILVDDHGELLSCWQTPTMTLVCGAFNQSLSMNNLTWSSDNRNRSFKSHPSENLKVVPDFYNNQFLIVTSHPHISCKQLRNTNSLDGGPKNGLPMIGRYTLDQMEVALTTVILHSNSRPQRNNQLDYVHLFRHSRQIYIVLNDMHISTPPSNQPKLAIVSRSERDDTTSYSEQSLSCGEDLDDFYAKAASEHFDGHRHVLYVIFEKISVQPEDASTHLYKFYFDEPSPILKGSELLKIDGLSNANFLSTSGQRNGEVFFVGTASGLLTKLYKGWKLYTIDIHKHEVRFLSRREKPDMETCQNDVRYAPSDFGFILAATNQGEIHKLPMHSCHYYRDLNTCLTTNDPLGCVWCKDKCTTSDNCGPDPLTGPVIYEFHPQSGAILGSTRLTIRGKDFITNDFIWSIVNVDGQECRLEANILNDVVDVIDCQLEPVLRDTDAPINIIVSRSNRDPHKSWFVNSTASLETNARQKFQGRLTFRIPFQFKEVKVYGVIPAFGPRAGGTNVTVFGKNLDVGRHRTILLGNTACNIIKIKPSSITCQTNPFVFRTPSSQGEVLRVYIDGTIQNFAFNAEGLELAIAFQVTGESNFYQGIIGYIIIPIIVFIVILIALSARGRLSSWLVRTSSEPVNRDLGDINMATRSRTVASSDALDCLAQLNPSGMSGDYFARPNNEQSNQDEWLVDDVFKSILYQQKILISRNRLKLGHVLGSGHFGRVYKGYLEIDESEGHKIVAVKTLHNRCNGHDSTDIRSFLEEGMMMKDFAHENVLSLTGVTFEAKGLPMVVLPFMQYGDLKSYISDESLSPTVEELIGFGLQISKGMAYLADLKFVHRDLAARNCMLDENLVVKVADFGLSRDIYEGDYYASGDMAAKLPVRWMAIESLEKSMYSSKSDVWSFGVLLWELMSRGMNPYPGVNDFDVVGYLKEGRRLIQPRQCPGNFYAIMQVCWSAQPTDRPAFDELLVSITNVITELDKGRIVSHTMSQIETQSDLQIDHPVDPKIKEIEKI